VNSDNTTNKIAPAFFVKYYSLLATYAKQVLWITKYGYNTYKSIAFLRPKSKELKIMK